MSDSEEESFPDVDELKTELLHAFEQVTSTTAGTYGCKGVVERAPNPGIRIEGSEIIGLPLSSHDAEFIISKCRQSPFGKGEKTVIDQTVRNSWELDAAQLSLSNPDWTSFVNSLLDTVHTELGLTCHRMSVRAELYKLLIYEQGAFFKPHQDSEKVPGMFGTLIVCLPSKHEGGRLLLTHNKGKLEIETARTSVFETSFGAWYSDVLHEVEEVTSGRRMVLTYNLVQTSSLLQKAPDADLKARIVKALRLYDRSLTTNDDAYPPYLLHQLEHFYSRQGTNLDMLKGRDLSLMRTLVSACRDTGFDIFFATYERTVEKDDEYGDEELNSFEEFDHVMNLDGTEVKSSPEYDEYCRLIEYDAENDDPDDEEHEGYTGNEGAPATYWYRHTLVLLVAPQRRLEFAWTGDGKFDYARKNLESLRVKGTSDSDAKRELYRLCHVLLPQKTGDEMWKNTIAGYDWTYKHSLYSEHTDVFIAVVAIAFQYDWINLFDRIPHPAKSAPESIDTICHYLVKNNLRTLEDGLNNMIKGAVSIGEKYKLLRDISESFWRQATNLEPEASQRLEFEAWCKIVIDDILNTKPRSNKADGASLGEITRTLKSVVSDRVSQKLESAGTQTIAAYLLSFEQDNHYLAEESQRKHLGDVLATLWNNFNYADPYRTHGSTVDALNQDELAKLLALTDEQGDIAIADVFETLCEALCSVDVKYMYDVLFPFIRLIMTHQIPCLILEDSENKPGLFDAVSTYIQLTLATYVCRKVGQEPICPQDWSISSARGCGCQDCSEVMRFMVNPTQQTIRLVNYRNRKGHLDSRFGHPSYGNKYKDWDISVDTRKKPMEWICTKDHKTYRANNADWKQRLAEARVEILDSCTNRDINGLRPYLGENFDDITSCQVERLPSLSLFGKDLLGPGGRDIMKERVEASKPNPIQPLKEFDAFRFNAAAGNPGAIQTPNSLIKKRKFGVVDLVSSDDNDDDDESNTSDSDISDQENMTRDSVAKRVKIGENAAGADIIDLTGLDSQQSVA